MKTARKDLLKIIAVGAAGIIAGTSVTAATIGATKKKDDVKDTETTVSESTSAKDTKTAKDETVYVIANADGSVKKIIVSDWIKNSLKEKQDDIKEKRDKMLRDAREEARNILEEAKEVADESIRKYHAWGQHPKQNNMKKMEAQRSDLRGRMSKLDKKLAYKAKKSSTISDPSDFKVGDSVFVTTLSLNGTVKEAANKDGDLVIQMGFLSSVVNYKNLELLAPEKAPKPQHQPKDRYSINKAATINPEINLLGNTVDEAIARLEKYLDDAMIAGLTSVRVVHGKGTGALRKGIHEYLRKLKFVKSYKLAEFGEGDAGVTIVTFK